MGPSTDLRKRLSGLIARRIGRPLGRWTRQVIFRAGLTPERAPKVFCLSMQRSGTTSFGDFCEDHLGMVRRGFYHSITNGWTRSWVARDYDKIFASVDFRTAEVFEDDPWWCPEFYKVLAPRFPQARFVLMTRDEAAWFRSMLAHSGGRTLGQTDLHAAIYGRQDEFAGLLKSGQPFRDVNWQGLSLEGQEARYTAHYRRHADECRRYFAAQAPERFLDLRLEDPDKFRKLAIFLGYPDRDYPDVHVNPVASPHDAHPGPEPLTKELPRVATGEPVEKF